MVNKLIVKIYIVKKAYKNLKNHVSFIKKNVDLALMHNCIFVIDYTAFQVKLQRFFVLVSAMIKFWVVELSFNIS